MKRFLTRLFSPSTPKHATFELLEERVLMSAINTLDSAPIHDENTWIITVKKDSFSNSWLERLTKSYENKKVWGTGSGYVSVERLNDTDFEIVTENELSAKKVKRFFGHPGFVSQQIDRYDVGVYGQVRRWSGDFMPMVGGNPNGVIEGIPHAKIHVFRGTLAPQGPDLEHPQLIDVITADKNGSYAIGLKPGTYTLVYEREGELYLNRYDGLGSWSSIEVVEDKLTYFNIDDTSGASF